MADYGTIVQGDLPVPYECIYQVGTVGVGYGAIESGALPDPVDGLAYGIGGTTAPPASPTIGQLWPLGTTAEVAAVTETYPVIVYSVAVDTTAQALPGRDYVYIATTAPITVTLPTAVGNASRYTMKNTAASGSVTVATTGGQTIDGSSTFVLNVRYMSIDLVSNGTNWVVF